MAFLTTWFVYYINIFNGFRKKHSAAMLFLLIALLGVLMGAGTQDPDIHNYIIYYYHTWGIVSPDIGYRYFSLIFWKLGFDYQTFRLISSFLGILLIHQTVRKLTDNHVFFYLLYFMYPFMLDVVQVRNFFAMAIFIYAIPYLISEELKDKVKYVLLILIAASFQAIAVIYLPFVAISYIRKNTLWRIILFFMIAVGILAGINKPFLNSLTGFLLDLFSLSGVRIDKYTKVETRFGFLLFWGIQIIDFVLIAIAKHISTMKMRNEGFSEKENYQAKFILLVYWINIVAFLFMPLYVFQATWVRVMRNFIPLNYIAFCIAGRMLPKGDMRKLILGIVIFGYALVMFYIQIYHPYNATIVQPMFKDNWLFKLMP